MAGGDGAWREARERSRESIGLKELVGKRRGRMKLWSGRGAGRA